MALKKMEKDELKPLLQKFLLYIGIFTMAILLFILWGFNFKFEKSGLAFRIVAFLTISGAYFLSGIILGFLFGMPRSEKFRSKTVNGNDTTNQIWYTDNTNLEDVSDWLTKIIVGLSLVNFDKIIKYTDLSAKNIAKSISGPEGVGNIYSLSYAIIILFMAAGFISSYLWAFAILRSILIKRKLDDINVLTPEVVKAVSTSASHEQINTDIATGVGAPDAFKNLIEEKLASKEVKVKDDLQKNRWGGKKEHNGKKLNGIVDKNKLYPSFFDLTLQVFSTDPAQPLTGWVAFFVHDTFGFKDNVVYAQVNDQGVAEIPLVGYQAFTAGALTEDDTELELDLNNEKGYPEGFYW